MTTFPLKQSLGIPLAGVERPVVPFVATQNAVCVHCPDRSCSNSGDVMGHWLGAFEAFVKWASPSRALLRCHNWSQHKQRFPWAGSALEYELREDDVAGHSQEHRSPVMSYSGVCGLSIWWEQESVPLGEATLGVWSRPSLPQKDSSALLISGKTFAPLQNDQLVQTLQRIMRPGYCGNLSKTLSSFLCRPG